MSPLQVADPYATQRQMARKAGYSDSEIDSYITQKFGSQRAQTQSAPKQPKKVGGLRGALLNVIPTATSAIGTVAGGVAGTLLAPGAGTAAGAVGGGAVGGGIGEFLRSKLAGEETKVGNVARETAFGALGGVGKGVQAVKAARGAKAAVKAAEQTTEGAMLARKGIAARAKPIAQQASQEGYGLRIGQSVGRGKTMRPDDADQLQKFITQRSQQYGGIRPGKPINQARDAQAVYKNVVKSLDDSLASINRPVDPREHASIVANAFAKIGDNPAITGTTKTADKFKTKIENAKSLKELEKLRREADDLAFTSTGAGKTSAAAQAHAVRDAIDEFITPLSSDYKAIKGDYTLARDALDFTSKASKDAKGYKLPFINVEVGKQALPGIKNKMASKVAGESSAEAAQSGYRPYTRQVISAVIPQASYRAGSSVILGTPFASSGQQETQELPGAMPTGMPQPPQEATAMQEAPPASMFGDRAKVEQVYMQALQNGDIETANAIMKGYELFGQTAAAEKPLSAEASKVIANANSGLTSIADLEQMLQQDPEALKKTIVPGRSMFGGAVGNALGTAEYDTVARNIADVITRLRTGAALTSTEEQFYKSQLPQAFDSPEVINKKIQQFKELFSSVANRTGTAGTDMQAAVGV